MSHSPARRLVARSLPSRRMLRLYDPRLSAILQSLPQADDTLSTTVDLIGWIEGRAPLVSAGGNVSRQYQAAKRFLDIVGSLTLLLLLGPILLGVWTALVFTTRGHPIFRQTRVGRCGRRFEMYKFRTMQLGAHEQQDVVPNEASGPVFKNRCDPRVTRLGHWLRRLSLDELPQLVNVLRGEMSLVGPRPPIPREVAEYEPRHCLRLAVKPGLTCLWQVSGRCDIEFDDWMLLDEWYVRNQSLRTDLLLLLRTPWSVLSCRGAY